MNSKHYSIILMICWIIHFYKNFAYFNMPWNLIIRIFFLIHKGVKTIYFLGTDVFRYSTTCNNILYSTFPWIMCLTKIWQVHIENKTYRYAQPHNKSREYSQYLNIVYVKGNRSEIFSNFKRYVIITPIVLYMCVKRMKFTWYYTTFKCRYTCTFTRDTGIYRNHKYIIQQ